MNRRLRPTSLIGEGHGGSGETMPDNLEELLMRAKATDQTPEDQEEQRRSFAYGNTHLENPFVTREMVDEAADQLAADDKKARAT